MKTLASTLALALALAFAGPAFAGDVTTAKTQADCEKAGGTWDAGMPTAYQIQNGGMTWSVSNPDSSTFRFELRPGDPSWSGDASTGRGRSEIAVNQLLPSGTPIHISYDFKVEPGAVDTASWGTTIGQLHNGPDNHGAALQIDMYYDHLRVIIRNGPAHSGEPSILLWQDPNLLVRGQTYHMDIQAFLSNDLQGSLVVTRDGTQVVNYHGAFGYGDPVYWKEGIYQNNVPQTVAVDYSNLHISTPSLNGTLTASGFTMGGSCN